MRIDADVIAQLRASGPGWQTRVNALLRAQVGSARTGKPHTVSPLAAVEQIQSTMNNVIDTIKKQMVRESSDGARIRAKQS